MKLCRHEYQGGQSMVEFVAGVVVFVAFLIGIPIVAKIANINIMSIQALDYAAWRVREGNTDDVKLTSEVSDRYFGETALVVSDDKIAHAGARLGRGKDFEQIYQADTVSVMYTKKSDIPKVDNTLKDRYNLPLSDKAGEVVINVPLENLDVLPEISSTMTISKSMYIDNQALTARDSIDIRQKLDSVDKTIIPYNSGHQKNLYKNTINPLIRLLRIASVGHMNEYTIEDVHINENGIPKDRLVEYRP